MGMGMGGMNMGGMGMGGGQQMGQSTPCMPEPDMQTHHALPAPPGIAHLIALRMSPRPDCLEPRAARTRRHGWARVPEPRHDGHDGTDGGPAAQLQGRRLDVSEVQRAQFRGASVLALVVCLAVRVDTVCAYCAIR